jgi:Spy/CpxP family protein refolding chaperone
MGLSNSNTGSGNARKGGGLRQMYELAKPALHLSADQESKIEALLKDLREERESIKSSGDNNQEQLRTARQQARQKLMDVLNPEQKAIWQENIKTWKEQND